MSEPRSETQIFTDLRDLCREPGFLHAISSIKFRDFYTLASHQGAVSPTDDDRYSRSRLNNNELMLLVGLLAQAESPAVFEEVADTAVLVSRADQLLEEFHAHLETPMRNALQTLDVVEHPLDRFGGFAKEAIYYGADSAFSSQYRRFARERYRHDFEWLLANTGLSIKSMIEIAQYIAYTVDAQLNILLAPYEAQGSVPDPHALTAAFLVAKTRLARLFRDKSVAFLDLFSSPINYSNAGFTHPFAYNQTNSGPILDLGNYVYLANEYKLFESLYESPYYWMLSDERYRDTAANNRGRFLEGTITRMAERTFGEDHVFANAVIRHASGDIAAEADVLVVYGEFILVIQAKPKRLTLEARSGVTEKLKGDFRSSVQAAYEQATKFIALAVEGRECEVGAKGRRSFKQLSRVFPVVVLSDHFPSLTILARHLITRHRGWPPAIIDVFFLDALFELLRHPVDILYYVQQRSRFFDKIWTDSEFNLHGFHMKQKLYVGDDIDFMMVDQDVGAEVSKYFAAKEAGADPSTTFRPLEERVDVPAITALISALKEGSPEVAGIAIELLDFSEEALRQLAENMTLVQAEVRAGKRFKAFSIETSYGGVSYVAVGALDERAMATGEMIARKHKYRQKKDRWYVILDYVHSPKVADRIAVYLEEWTGSDDMEQFMEDIGPLLKETYVTFKPRAGMEEEHPTGNGSF